MNAPLRIYLIFEIIFVQKVYPIIMTIKNEHDEGTRKQGSVSQKIAPGGGRGYRIINLTFEKDQTG